VLALGGVAACAPSQEGDAAASDSKVYEYRVATIEGVGTPMNDAFERFITEVDQCSDGRLKGQNFPAGQLGGFVDLIDGNRKGTYEITSGGFDVEGDLAPDLSALSLGYVFDDEEHVEKVIAEMQDEMSQKLEEQTGASIIGMGEDGWRWVFSSKEIQSIDDLAGVKIRVPEAEIPLGLWGALGASPAPVPFTEMYSALESGVIEAGESAVAQIQANAFWEPAKHLTNTKHWYNIKPVRANSDWLNSLPEDLQSCLKDTGEKVFSEARKQNREQADEMLAEMESKGAVIHETPADLDVWKQRAETYNQEYFAKYPEAKDFIERVKALSGQ
jgi:TRAP-type C4-dicarboxylate transport system substrate-binding protein